MYLDAVYINAMSDDPNSSAQNRWTQAEIDNWIAWQSAQPIEVSFATVIAATSGAKTWGEWYAMPRSGVTREELIQHAIDALNQDAFKKSVGMAVNDEYNDPRWPQLTAARAAAAEAERIRVANTPSPFSIGPGPNVQTTRAPATTTPARTTPTPTASVPATREQVLYVFRNTPGANPQPDEAAISYYMSKGVAQLVADIAAIRKSNPALAAQIDAQRKAMGLPTATSATTITPSKPAAGGTAALLLAAAAAYLLGS